MIVTALVLAAGRSTRMGESNKLTLDLDGKPLLCHAVDTLLATSVDEIHVVTGHEADSVRACLAGRRVSFVHNPDYASGMASSIAAGIRTVANADAILLCLGDMPDLPANVVEALIAAFDTADAIVLPVCDGRRGHPVLFGAAHFASLEKLSGDRGARDLLDRGDVRIVEVATDQIGVHRDVDTPRDLGR